MRMSCNGCRVLRKGCTLTCILKPCLQWINSPDAQGHATLFLAKFYGRAGLLNLLAAGPDHLRPEIFKSLLYEACGRIINPIYGAVGLSWSGNWQRCEAAVDEVLKGSSLLQFSIDNAAADHPIVPLQGCDIRHLPKDSNAARPVRTRNRSKRSGLTGKSPVDHESFNEFVNESPNFSITGWDYDQQKDDVLARAQSHDSLSVQTFEPSLVINPYEQPVRAMKTEAGTGTGLGGNGEILLELTLGMNQGF